jgi:NACalpha-BTF3-like transcription factor
MVKYLSIDPAIKNLGIVKLNIDDNNDIKIIETNLIDLTGGQKVKKCSFEHIIDSLIDNLKLIDIKDIDCVLIENIPSFKNPSIKTISSIIYGYYREKGLNTKFVSPSKKLKGQDKMTYAERKKEGIKKCFELIKEEDVKLIKEQFKSKMNDITDCIIQAYEFNKSNK